MTVPTWYQLQKSIKYSFFLILLYSFGLLKKSVNFFPPWFIPQTELHKFLYLMDKRVISRDAEAEAEAEAQFKNQVKA